MDMPYILAVKDSSVWRTKILSKRAGNALC